MKKEDNSEVRSKGPAKSLEDYTHTLKPNQEKSNPYPLNFRTIMDQWLFHTLCLLLFWSKISTAPTLGLSPQRSECWGHINGLFSFINSQIERNLAQDLHKGISPRSLVHNRVRRWDFGFWIHELVEILDIELMPKWCAGHGCLGRSEHALHVG